VHCDPHVLHGRPGTRAPHLWLVRAEQQISTLDLFGNSFVVLATSQGKAWCAAARGAARLFPDVPIDAYVVGSADLQDAAGAFATAYGLGDAGAVLVRPDGFVAWRAKTLIGDPQDALIRALAAILMKH
jgi:putative polyketide hydroxylase